MPSAPRAITKVYPAHALPSPRPALTTFLPLPNLAITLDTKENMKACLQATALNNELRQNVRNKRKKRKPARKTPAQMPTPPGRCQNVNSMSIHMPLPTITKPQILQGPQKSAYATAVLSVTSIHLRICPNSNTFSSERELKACTTLLHPVVVPPIEKLCPLDKPLLTD